MLSDSGAGQSSLASLHMWLFAVRLLTSSRLRVNCNAKVASRAQLRTLRPATGVLALDRHERGCARSPPRLGNGAWLEGAAKAEPRWLRAPALASALMQRSQRSGTNCVRRLRRVPRQSPHPCTDVHLPSDRLSRRLVGCWPPLKYVDKVYACAVSLSSPMVEARTGALRWTLLGSRAAVYPGTSSPGLGQARLSRVCAAPARARAQVTGAAVGALWRWRLHGQRPRRRATIGWQQRRESRAEVVTSPYFHRLATARFRHRLEASLLGCLCSRVGPKSGARRRNSIGVTVVLVRPMCPAA